MCKKSYSVSWCYNKKHRLCGLAWFHQVLLVTTPSKKKHLEHIWKTTLES